jgi:hypothetical protein
MLLSLTSIVWLWLLKSRTKFLRFATSRVSLLDVNFLILVKIWSTEPTCSSFCICDITCLLLSLAESFFSNER